MYTNKNNTKYVSSSGVIQTFCIPL